MLSLALVAALAGCTAPSTPIAEASDAAPPAQAIGPVASPPSGTVRATLTGACADTSSGWFCVGRTTSIETSFEVSMAAREGAVSFAWTPTDEGTKRMRVHLHDSEGRLLNQAEGESPLVLKAATWEKGGYKVSVRLVGSLVGAIEQDVEWSVAFT